jgi:homospermidine synthase
VAEAKAQPAAVEPQQPDVPPFVAKCIKDGLAENNHQKQAAKAKPKQETQQDAAKVVQGQGVKSLSADQLVLTRLRTDEERRKCGKAVLEWYRELQKLQKAKVAAK